MSAGSGRGSRFSVNFSSRGKHCTSSPFTVSIYEVGPPLLPAAGRPSTTSNTGLYLPKNTLNTYKSFFRRNSEIDILAVTLAENLIGRGGRKREKERQFRGEFPGNTSFYSGKLIPSPSVGPIALSEISNDCQGRLRNCISCPINISLCSCGVLCFRTLQPKVLKLNPDQLNSVQCSTGSSAGPFRGHT